MQWDDSDVPNSSCLANALVFSALEQELLLNPRSVMSKETFTLQKAMRLREKLHESQFLYDYIAKVLDAWRTKCNLPQFALPTQPQHALQLMEHPLFKDVGLQSCN